MDEQPTVISSELSLPPQPRADSAERMGQGSLLPGDRLEHFELLEFVGGGGMGRVFRARDTRLDRIVALKVLAPGQIGDGDALARFRNEAQSAARLNHDNVARVFHVGEDRGLNYIVFEYIEGVDLRALIHENGPLSLADAISYTLQVAEALAHAAGRDVVHRDIKPSNVLVTPSGRAKLIDMGLARLHRIDPVAADLTASGVTLGTFDYISPEQARDPRNVDVRSDIYSLGCTFFFMLAGRPPFPEGTVLQKLLQHQGDEPPDVRQFRSDTPDALVSVLRRMLAKDPRNRYPTATELLDELTALAGQLGMRPLSASGHVWELPRPPRISPLARHLPWLAPTVALLCVVAALHVWGGNDHPPPPILGGPEVLVGKLPDPAEFAPPLTLDDDAVRPVDDSAQPSDDSRLADRQEPRLPAVPPEPEPGRAAPTQAAPERPSDPEVPAQPPDSEPLATAPKEPPAPTETADRPAIEATKPSQDDAPPVDRPDPGQQSGVVVVNGGGKDEAGFPSLNAALAAAETGNVIELRYDGRREQAPVKIASRRLTIRAGEGFRPVIVFRPEGNDPVRQPRSMVTVTSGDLRLIGLAFELDVSRDVAGEQWSLVELFGGAQVNLQQCALSIRNASDSRAAYHPDVAFFRTRPVLGSNGVAADSPEEGLPPIAIELADCSVRGQATLLRAEAFQSVHLEWENGFLATSEQLVSLAAGGHAPAEADAVTLNLRHLTALLGGSLLTMTDRQPSGRQLSTSIVLSDSIAVGAPGVPFVDQYSEEGDDPRQKVRFQGNRNFYEGIDVFWRLRGAADEPPLRLLDFDAWQAHWGAEDENLPTLNGVKWQQQPDPGLPGLPIHLFEVSSFALSPDATANPARGAASNGRDAGCDPARLPEFPKP